MLILLSHPSIHFSTKDDNCKSAFDLAFNKENINTLKLLFFAHNNDYSNCSLKNNQSIEMFKLMALKRGLFFKKSDEKYMIYNLLFSVSLKNLIDLFVKNPSNTLYEWTIDMGMSELYAAQLMVLFYAINDGYYTFDEKYHYEKLEEIKDNLIKNEEIKDNDKIISLIVHSIEKIKKYFEAEFENYSSNFTEQYFKNRAMKYMKILCALNEDVQEKIILFTYGSKKRMIDKKYIKLMYNVLIKTWL
jgi:hypothetical protein